MLNITNEELRNYLSSMKKILRSKNGRLVIIVKEKNDVFRYLYQLTKKDIRKYLISLKVEEFEEKRESIHPDHIGELLYIWSPTRILTAQDGAKVEEKLYVKTYIDEKKDLIIVISFHRYGDFSCEENRYEEIL